MEKLLSQRQQGLHTYDRRLKDGKAVVPAAARAPHVRPSCPLHLARVMKTHTRPLSKKRAAEEILGRVHLARLYDLWQAEGAARRPAHHPLWASLGIA
jgi:hypothetical protein